jgi:hypothetical protein
MSVYRLTIFALPEGKWEVRWDNPSAEYIQKMKKQNIPEPNRPVVLKSSSEQHLEAELQRIIAVKHRQGCTVWIANNVTGRYTAYCPDPSTVIRTRLQGTA